jgi:hypothetical protein
MTETSVAQQHLERYHIHIAVCRARRAEMVCSTCCELSQRAERAAAQTIRQLAEVA